MNRRILGLVVAILLAGVATFFLVQYVTTADERAREAEELVEVVVAEQEIPTGTAVEDASAQGLFGTDEIPARSVPGGAIDDPAELAGLVATGPVFPGEVIVAQRFGQTAALPGVGLDIPDGLEAVTVDAGVIEGVAGFVQPQDEVSVLASITLPDADENEDADLEAGTTGLRTQYLVQNVTVLAVGQRVITTEGDTQDSSIQLSNDRYIFTLAMEPEEIERLIFAYQEGVLHFTILPELDDDEAREVVDTPGRSIEDLFE